MSSQTDTTFHIYYDGKFETSEDGRLSYIGGTAQVLETQARSFFASLNLPIDGQMIWFKMPFEGLSDLKLLLRDGDDSFDRMCKSAAWTKFIDIFMERDEESGEEEGIGENETEKSKEAESSEEEQIEKEKGPKNLCEEEARVEKIVADCNDDEDDQFSYRNTPPQSDCEEETDCYERWRRGSGELKIKQVFESLKEFKEAVLEYALLGGWNIKFNRWGRIKSEAICGVEKGDSPCPWRIYCSYDGGSGFYMVKTFQEEHTCFKDGHCKILMDSQIALMFINDVRNDPLYTPKEMMKQIQERYNLIPSYDQCRKAKKKALAMIQAEYDEEYRRIKDYEAEIIDSNPGSTTDLVTFDGGEGLEVFDRFYVCFAGLRKVWLNYCRPIFGIDGCFLKSDSKGQLLTAVGRDANNQIYPVAWAVVNSENADTWSWFISKLKTDLDLKDGDGFTLVSDRQKGLLKAVDQELPKVEHRMCARHIYGNLKKNFPRKPEMKSLFWAIVESHNSADYEASLAEMKKYDIDVYEALMARNPKTCSRAFFKTTSKCEDALNNFSESYNSAIEKSRALPLVKMLETMRRQTMVRIDLRKKNSSQHKAKFTPKVARTTAVEDKQKKWCCSYPGPNGLFEVVERGTAYRINMRTKTCTCRRWDLTGIPCRHALRVAMDKKTYKKDDMVADCYLTSTWQDQYSDSIKPLNGLMFWNKTEESTIEAPPRDINKGRKKNPAKRIKGVNESPTKGKKVTQHGRTVHCSRCGLPGHNSTKCRNGGVPIKPRPPKKARRSMCDEVTIGLGDGPSQTQPSQS